MTTIRFRDSFGETREIEAINGESIMQAAVSKGVAGVIGECGGALMCSTCHVYIEEQNTPALPPMQDDEDEMLGAAAAERRPTSRLGCQIRIQPVMEGLCVETPASQY